MEHRTISIWLKKKAASDAALSFVSGILILAGGVVVLVITFICAYAGTWFVTNLCLSQVSQGFRNRPFQVPAGVNLAISAVMVSGLFYANARLRRLYWRKLEAKRRMTSRSDLPAPLVHLLAFPGASARTHADVLFCGPRLVEIGLDQLKKARRLGRLNSDDCARIMAVLASRDSRVSISELSKTAGVTNLPDIYSQLCDISGVVFLDSDAPGLSLTSDLRNELFRELGILPRRRIDADQRDSPTSRTVPCDVSERVGIGAAAALDEFEAADAPGIQPRGGHSAPLSPEAQRQIEAVNAAYEAFLSKREQKQAEEAQHPVEGVWEQFKRLKKP